MADDEAPEAPESLEAPEPLDGLPDSVPPPVTESVVPTRIAVPAAYTYNVSLAPGSIVTKLNVKRADGSRIEIGPRAVSIAGTDLETVKAGARSTGVALRIGIST